MRARVETNVIQVQELFVANQQDLVIVSNFMQMDQAQSQTYLTKFPLSTRQQKILEQLIKGFKFAAVLNESNVLFTRIADLNLDLVQEDAYKENKTDAE